MAFCEMFVCEIRKCGLQGELEGAKMLILCGFLDGL